MITTIDDLPFSGEILQTLRTMGITTLYPPQSAALEHVLAGRHLVLSVPTASGKSLVAYLAILRGLAAGGKALYIVPLRALASEKFEDIRELLPTGYSAAMSIGDYAESDRGLLRNDVIVATSEKADSLFRHHPDFLAQFSVVIADEVHLMTDPGRGHILEVLLTRLRMIGSGIQIVALSATIPNSEEIAEWLGAAHLKSDWRPISLREGVFHDGVLRLTGDSCISERKIGTGDPVKVLIKDGLALGGQCLVFVNTRKSAEVAALKLAHRIPTYTEVRCADLAEAAEGLIATQDEPTDMVTRLATCVRGATAFHHAGLGNTQRKIVERAFKSGMIKVLIATPTLAAGINLPARRVVIRDMTRFGGRGYGNQPIPNLELKQMAGRAGRPGYDPFGEAVFLAREPDDVDRIFRDVINGPTERIESKLGVAPILRIHIISSIASGHVRDHASLMNFLGSTFYAHQFRFHGGEIASALRFLVENGMLLAPELPSGKDFVTADTLSGQDPQEGTEGEAGLGKEDGAGYVKGGRKGDGKGSGKGDGTEGGTVDTKGGATGRRKGGGTEGGIEVGSGDGAGAGISGGNYPVSVAGTGKAGVELRATPFGKLVSDLYIDPKSAVIMKLALERTGDDACTSLSYLHTICATPDMLTLHAREAEMGELLLMAELYRDELPLTPMDRMVYGENPGLGHELFAEDLKTAFLLKRWIDETDENTITDTYNIGPGDLRNKVDTARWLLHALGRIASLFHHGTDGIRRLEQRMIYGIREELLPLVALKGVGRIKARILHRGGYRDPAMLRNADIHRLLELPGIGRGTVFAIMDQLGRDMSEYEITEEEVRKLQRSLFDFDG